MPIGGPSSVTYMPSTVGPALTISGTNTYLGSTTLSGSAQVNISSDANLGVSSAPLIFAPSTGRLNVTSSITTPRPVILNGIGTLNVSTGKTLELDGPISGSSELLVIGSIYLNNQTATPNSYAGGTSISNNTTLSVHDGTQLSSGAVTFTGSGNFLTINPGSSPLPFSTTISNTINLPSGPAPTINIPGNVTLNLSGNIVGSSTSHLIINGVLVPSGTLVLSGNNFSTFLGLLDNRQFTNLQISSGLNLPNGSTGALAFSNSSTLTITASTTINTPFQLHEVTAVVNANPGTSTTIASTVLFNGGSMTSFEIAGGGTIALTNTSNTYQGGTIVSGSTLQVPSDSVLGFKVTPGDSSVTLENGSVFEVTASPFNSARTFNLSGNEEFLIDTGTTMLTGVIQDGTSPGNLIKSGPGILVLAGTNTYSGSTTIDMATLSLKGGGSISSTSSLTLANSGTTFDISGSILPSNVVNNLSGVSGSTVNLGSSNLTLNQTIDNTFAGTIQGGGSVTIEGGSTFTLTGLNTYTGQTTVNSGTLIVNGVISSSPIDVLAGATLAGSGTVADVINSGIISPGNSMGTDTLTGHNFTFNAGSEYDIELIGNVSDQIIANGSIAINPGTTLRITKSMPTSTLYLIAHANNGITGSFSNFIAPPNRFHYGIIQEPDDLFLSLSLIPFPNIFPSGNLRNIAVCLDSLESEGLLSQNITDIFNTMSLTSIESTLEKLDPSIFNGLNITEQNVAGSLLSLYTNRMHTIHDEASIQALSSSPFSVWIAPFYQETHQDSLGTTTALTGYRNSDEGILSGIDFRPSKQLFLTAGFGYVNTQLDWQDNPNKGWLSSYGAIVAATWKLPRLLLDACFSYIYNDVRTKREFNFASDLLLPNPLIYEADSRSKNHANSYATSVGAIYDILQIQGNSSFFTLWPYLNLQYINVQQEKFSEYGSELSMTILNKSFDVFKSDVGLGCSYILQRNFFDYFADLSIGYRAERRFQGNVAKAKFNLSQSCTFNVRGLFPDQNLVAPKARLGIKSTLYPLSLFLCYTGGYGKNFKETQIALECNTSF